ncbi:hypothetical protein BJX96DRAFT_148513 [Aspergillus floccosus]
MPQGRSKLGIPYFKPITHGDSGSLILLVIQIFILSRSPQRPAGQNFSFNIISLFFWPAISGNDRALPLAALSTHLGTNTAGNSQMQES